VRQGTATFVLRLVTALCANNKQGCEI